jgi:hypothetical protein
MLAVVRELEVYDIEQFRDQLERKDLCGRSAEDLRQGGGAP